MLTATDYKKARRRERIKKECNYHNKKVNELREQNRKCEYATGMYLQETKMVRVHKTVIVPEHSYMGWIFDGCNEDGNVILKPVIKTVPEKSVKVLDHTDFIELKSPLIKRSNLNNRRQYAKKMTNKKCRHLKQFYETGVLVPYITLNNKGEAVTHYKYEEEPDWDVNTNRNPSGYRKKFDYKWEIW